MEAYSKIDGEPTRMTVPVTSDGFCNARWSNARISWCAWRAEIPKFLHFVCEKNIFNGANSARSRRAQYGFESNDISFESFRDVVRFAQRTLAELKHFLCASGAPEILQFFYVNLPQHLRDLDDGRTIFFSLHATPTQRLVSAMAYDLRNAR